MTDKIDYLAAAITESLGGRCVDVGEGCPTCEAWKDYDRLKALKAELDAVRAERDRMREALLGVRLAMNTQFNGGNDWMADVEAALSPHWRTAMHDELKKRYEEAQVGIASRGQPQPDGKLLPPHLWEQLRQNLQAKYRLATGEKDAVLTLEAALSTDAEPVYEGKHTIPMVRVVTEDDIDIREPAPPVTQTGGVESEIERIVQSVNEWDDRTSPDDYPDHLLITSEELTLILRNFAAALSASEGGE